ncbi:MAG TPA: hypothetical protein VEU96_10545 [Bryobacteraceae bacterium]|nr:hypothetical protein [Bryobacteraceae bacterium]
MEPFEKDELSDAELDHILRSWSAPAAPARIRAAVFPASSTPWWKRFLTMSIPVPLPVAFCLAFLIAAGVWRWTRPVAPVAPQVLVKTQRVEVPVVQDRVVTKYVYRNAPVAQSAVHSVGFDELRPVAELRPRIIRNGNAKN